MPANSPDTRTRLRKELILFASMLAIGLIALPAAIYLVGNAIFGGYDGGDYFDFAGVLWRKLLGGDMATLFLTLSPYLVWQCLRITLRLFRRPATS